MSTKHVAAIFMADPEAAQELADRLAAEDVEPLLPQGSDALYHTLNHERVDVVVIDHDLRGFLSGLEILERMYNDLLRPATVLIGQLVANQNERARKLGINCVLRPGCDLETIKNAAKALLATTKVGCAVIPPEARRLVVGADVIRPLPQLLIKLSQFLDSEALSMTDLANDISVDPRITAELLKLTNSSTFALSRKVTKVSEAVNLLGIRRTISLILSAGLIGAQAGILKTWPESLRTWYHQRSVLIASTAAAFARNLEDVSPDTAFILGLMQDTGILILAHAHSQRYLHLLRRVQEIPQLRLEINERQDYGTNHAEVSAALLHKWELPQSLVLMVLHHHAPETFPMKSETEQRFLRVMQIGEAVANLADGCSPQRYQILDRLLAGYGRGQADLCRTCLAEAVAKTAESSRLFAIPVPDDAALEQMLKRITGGAAAAGETRSAPVDAPPQDMAPAIEPQPQAAHAAIVPPPKHKSSPPSWSGETASGRPREHGNALRGPALPASAAAPEVAAVNRRVLFVEDDPIVIAMVTHLLALQGIDVVSCSSLQEARPLAARSAAILCDIHLGAENGIAIVRTLRGEGCTRPVIMVSGDRSRATVEECIGVGISGYLVKPFSNQALLQKIQQLTDLLPERVLV